LVQLGNIRCRVERPVHALFLHSSGSC
jgi:hypothetical protein